MKILSRTPHPRRIKLRIMGSEIEWGMRFLPPPQANPPKFSEAVNRLNNRYQLGNYAESFVRGALPGNLFRRFRVPRAILLNQGQMYVDSNTQIEYATPECLGAEQLALYETAGLDIVAYALKKFNDASANELAPIKIYKTNRGAVIYDNAFLGDESCGSHANYLTMRRVSLPELYRLWLPFLQTRWCVNGNGWIDFFDQQYIHFLFSQRADVMKHEKLLGTTGTMKPLVHNRDEPLARDDVWRRLHDVSENANMSQKQLFLKYAVSDIVLAMIEAENFLREPPHFHEKRYNANEVCRCFNGDIFGHVHLECEDGTRHGFLDVQEFYIEEALRFFREGRATLTDERRRALELWQSVIDAMRRRDLKYLARFLDWAALLRQFELLFAKLGLDFGAFCDMETDARGRLVRYPAGREIRWDSTVPRKNKQSAKLLPYLLEYIVQYADVETERSPYGVLAAHGALDTLFTREEIAQAVLNPPARTRAHLRETVEKTVGQSGVIMNTSWTHEAVSVQLESGSWHTLNIPLLNPYRFMVGPEEKRILSLFRRTHDDGIGPE